MIGGLSRSCLPFDTGRRCDRSAEPEHPARPVEGPGRLPPPATGHAILASVVVEPGKTDDRTFAVLTVREGSIVALRDCRDRDEALAVAGIPGRPS
jgi:hypothetical protein